MINIVTNHNEMYQVDTIVADIIKEYQTNGFAVIQLNSEGPSATAIGLYKMLDHICDKFNFNKSNIMIITNNSEEVHDSYKIRINEQVFLKFYTNDFLNRGYTKENFLGKKDILANTFGCMYNIPSWNRLCLLSYIKFNTNRNSLLACNATFTERQHNTVTLDKVIENAPNELYTIIDYLKTNPVPLSGHPGRKPTEFENMEIIQFYNDFFIDVVAETYTTGLTFFVTEKTVRPMLALTPFITYGPRGFLSNLQARYGFKTFSNWWDESYDDYQGYDRIKEMHKVISTIDQLSDTELQSMYNDMTDTLEHNYNRLLEIYDKK